MLFGILILLCLFLLGLILEEITLFSEIKKISPPNKLTKTPRGNINIFSKGSGSTTVIIASSLYTTSPYCDFFSLQDKLSKFSRVVLYEKYGYGFSDDFSDDFNFDTLISDIRSSIRKNGNMPPYIFLCNGDSSLEVLRFAQLYPEEVLGIVFEDPINPANSNTIKVHSKLKIRILTFFKYTGILRLLYLIPHFKNKVIKNIPSKELQKLALRLHIKNFFSEFMIKENNNIKNNCSIVLNNNLDFKSIPIYILTAGKSNTLPYKDLVKTQEQLLSLSDNSFQIVVKGSDKYIHHHDENIIIQCIKEIMSK